MDHSEARSEKREARIIRDYKRMIRSDYFISEARRLLFKKRLFYK
jgi:hypothetical protein